MDVRNKATAPGGALGFGRRDRVVAKLCLLAFIELDGDAHRTRPHRVGRRFGKRFSKERHNLDAELLYVLSDSANVLVEVVERSRQMPDATRVLANRGYPLWYAASEGLHRVVQLFLGLGVNFPIRRPLARKDVPGAYPTSAEGS